MKTIGWQRGDSDLFTVGPTELPRSFWEKFEVYDTTAVLRIWNHEMGYYSGRHGIQHLRFLDPKCIQGTSVLKPDACGIE